MAHSLIQATSTAESWGQQVRGPQHLVERLRPTVEKLGGRLGPATPDVEPERERDPTERPRARRHLRQHS